MPRIGEAVEPARVERVDTWWRPTAELDKHGSQPSRVEEAAPPGVEQAIQWPID
jgi:hypothetical protein